jgi:hypothetical protein
VPKELFGTHVKGIAKDGQAMPPRAGAVRLWDSGVSWRELERKRGRIRWNALDEAVAKAEQTGAEDIMWVHGSPPRWAALDPSAAGLYGPGSSSVPDEEAYLSFLGKVAKRYKGRITSYQVWNEANIRIFYQGTPDSMAALTLKARDVLKKADRKATLVGASTTVRASGPVKPWYGRYSAGLARRGWPVDVMSVHLYPRADEGIEERAAYARTMVPFLANYGWKGPIWDTEINFGDRRAFATEKVRVPQKRAAAWVARTYIDSLALGIDRAYWYSWNDHILGIDQVDKRNGEVLPAGQAYLAVQEWLDGGWWRGCSGELRKPTGKSGAVTTCRMWTPDGQPARLIFTHKGSAKVAMPEGARRVCRLDGECSDAEGVRLRVGTEPVLVRISA